MRYFTQNDKPAFIRSKSRPITRPEKSIVVETHNGGPFVYSRAGEPVVSKEECTAADLRAAEHPLRLKGHHSLLLRDSEGLLWDLRLKAEAEDDPWYINGTVPEDAQIVFRRVPILDQDGNVKRIDLFPDAVVYTRVVSGKVISITLGIADAIRVPSVSGTIRFRKGTGGKGVDVGSKPTFPPCEKAASYTWQTRCQADIDRANRAADTIDAQTHAGDDLELRYTESRPHTGKVYPRRKGTDQAKLEIVKR